MGSKHSSNSRLLDRPIAPSGLIDLSYRLSVYKLKALENEKLRDEGELCVMRD